MRSIGLITYHHTTNFGSLLQTYALYKTVTQMGYNCKVIDYRNDAVEKREFIKHIYQCKDLRELKEHIKYARFKKRKAKVFAEFLKTNLAMSDLVYDRDNVQKANQEFDTFLVGSDLVWDFSINQNDLTYMLDFADKDAVKIAYAWKKAIAAGIMFVFVFTIGKNFSISIFYTFVEILIGAIVYVIVLVVLRDAFVCKYIDKTFHKILGQRRK